MKQYTTLTIIIALFILSCSPMQQPNDSGASVLGELQHGFTLNELTQEKFDEGLLLLHNFEYDDALVAFKEATALDSTEVLTHWGEAMCYYKALWKLQNTEDGKAVLSRLGDTKEKRLASIEDPIEKVMWELVEIMYGEGEFKERNLLIKEHLAAAHKELPAHQEIASFYALSLIWATEEYGNGSDDLKLAAAITDKITMVNPLHPGALHYKIHALDGPRSAKEALDAADAYAKVAADAAHALHMPSHIYLAMGEWEGVVNSNQKSYDASVERMHKLKLEDGARGYHSLAWLHYGLLQQGRLTEAESILNEMLTLVPKDPTKGARGYLVGMQSRQLAANGELSKKTKLDIDVKTDDISLTVQAARSFLRAQLAMKNEDVKTITEEIDWLSDRIYISAQQIEVGGAELCAAGSSRYAPTENGVKSAKVILNQLEGMKALMANNEQLFEKHMRKAVTLEEDTNFPAGPPRITIPSFEQYGGWLLQKEKYAEALEQFNNCLARMPRRSKSLTGKLAALKAMNKKNEADEIQNELQAIYAQADSEVRSLLND